MRASYGSICVKPMGVKFASGDRAKLDNLAALVTGGNKNLLIRALVRWATPEIAALAVREYQENEGAGERKKNMDRLQSKNPGVSQGKGDQGENRQRQQEQGASPCLISKS